jgi:putative NADH-flavin reductase
MKVAVIGATGNTGSKITAELLKRGHHVQAVVRSRNKIHSTDGLEVANNDLSDVAQLGFKASRTVSKNLFEIG